MPFRPDAVDANRDVGFYWQDMEGPADVQGDLFGQFVDFDGDAAADAFHGHADSLFLMDDQQHRVSESTGSSGISTSDDLDFIATSSHAAPTASHEIDPRELALAAEPHAPSQPPGRASVSETDLSRLEGISIHSPRKDGASNSDPSSPTPPTPAGRNKFVEALSSTIRKATTMRKTRKPLPEQRADSPIPDQPQSQPQQQPLKPPKQRRGQPRIVTQGAAVPRSPPVRQQPYGAGPPHFIHGFCDDPFNEGQLPPQPPLSASSMPYYGSAAVDTPLESPGVKSEPGQYPSAATGLSPWPPQHPHQPPDPALMGDYAANADQSWWQLGMFAPGANGEFANHHRSVNMASHAQHSGLPYEYAPMPDTGAVGLMIHMPQPRPSQPTVVNDLTVNAQTYLPPPPPPKGSASERPHRPPRAKSSGARHMSCSPVRKQRGPSASPNPGQQPRSRHSSGASVSSVRSASGRLPASMPGTPCSVRKRRSRDVSSGGGLLSGESGGGGGGSVGGDGLGGGFVNFTPSDGSLLMTGVAPSGSSKTKARREKEAQERRRRLSEAALKAVAAPGGDVDKLLEQGFAF